MEAGFESRHVGDAENEELIKFQCGEDLTVHDILDAPGEVIGKSSYGTLYRASLIRVNSVVVLRFLRPACTGGMKEVVHLIQVLGAIRHDNLVPLKAFYGGPRGEKLLVHPFFGRGNLAQFITGNNAFSVFSLVMKSVPMNQTNLCGLSVRPHVVPHRWEKLRKNNI